MAKVVILKQPLYGSVYWDGYKFVYTPKPGSTDNDSYIYAITDEKGNTQTLTNFVNPTNTPPLTSQYLSLTAKSNTDVVIPISALATDSTNTFNYFKILSTSIPKYGDIYNNGDTLIYVGNVDDIVENINFTISDKQFNTTGTFTISVIGPKKYTPTSLANSDNAFQLLTGVDLLLRNTLVDEISGWSAMYRILTSYRNTWDAIDLTSEIALSSLVSSHSGNWEDVANSQDAYKSVFNILTANSANWQSERSGLTGLSSSLDKYWRKWDNCFTTVSTYSGNWEQLTHSYGSLTATLESGKQFTDMRNVVMANSALWMPITQTVNTTAWNDLYNFVILGQKDVKWSTPYTYTNIVSAYYDKSKDKLRSLYQTLTSNTSILRDFAIVTLMKSMSAKWTNTRNTLTALSTNWVFDETPELSSWFSLLTSKSANWDTAYNIVSTNSANWLKNTRLPLSSQFLTGASNIDFESHDMIVYGNALIQGTLTAVGNNRRYDTTVYTTSGFTITNTDDQDALWVTKIGYQGGITRFEYPVGNTVLYVDANVGTVGINTDFPKEALTVVGNISATNWVLPIAYDILSVYSSNSSNWETANDYRVLSSGNINPIVGSKGAFDSSYALVERTSADIAAMYTLSTNYEQACTLIGAQSARNKAVNDYVSLCAVNLTQDPLFRANQYKYEYSVSTSKSQKAAKALDFEVGYLFSSTKPLTSGEAYIVLNEDVTIKSWTMISDVNTNAQMDVLVSNHSFFPVGKSIIDSYGHTFPPSLVNQNKATYSSLYGRWNTLSLPKGSIVIFKILNNSDAKTILFNLNVEKV